MSSTVFTCRVLDVGRDALFQVEEHRGEVLLAHRGENRVLSEHIGDAYLRLQAREFVRRELVLVLQEGIRAVVKQQVNRLFIALRTSFVQAIYTRSSDFYR